MKDAHTFDDKDVRKLKMKIIVNTKTENNNMNSKANDSDYILNPKSNRYVKRSGALGKLLEKIQIQQLVRPPELVCLESTGLDKKLQETPNDKLILSLKGTPITRSYQLPSLLSTIKERGFYPYWNKSKGDLFQRLILPNEADYVDSDLIWSSGSAEPKAHPSWFLVRTTKNSTPQQNSPKTCRLSHPFLSVNIMEGDAIAKQFLLEKNQKEMTRLKKSVNNAISHRLTGKKTKKEQTCMSDEEMATYKDLLKIQKDELYDSVFEEKHNVVQRSRLFRIYGTKKQYAFLRQQRGIYRHVYNTCCNDIKQHYRCNVDIIYFLQFLIDSDEIELTEDEESAIKQNIIKYKYLTEDVLRGKYQPDSYWKENKKEWGLMAPSNLRTASIQNLLSNINVAQKTAKSGFSMGMLSKKDDKISFQIPVSTQQINMKTGTSIPAIRKHKNNTLPTKTKDVIFQYMGTKCPDQGKFTTRVREKDNFPLSKSDIKHDCKFVYKSGCWYVSIPYDVHIENTKPVSRLCSIDPGVKTPYTVYDPHDGSITEIGTTKDSLKRIKNENSMLSTHAVLERIRRKCNRYQSRMDKEIVLATTKIEKRKLNKIKKCIRRLRYKKKCLIDELHYKTIKYLTSNYDVIMMPYFDTSEIVKKTLKKKTKRALLDLNFSLFRQRLACKAESQGVVWLEVGEAYTTKSCVQCGNVQNIGLQTRIFDCTNCQLKLGRDAHSAISILVKNADLTLPQGS